MAVGANRTPALDAARHQLPRVCPKSVNIFPSGATPDLLEEHQGPKTPPAVTLFHSAACLVDTSHGTPWRTGAPVGWKRFHSARELIRLAAFFGAVLILGSILGSLATVANAAGSF